MGASLSSLKQHILNLSGKQQQSLLRWLQAQGQDAQNAAKSAIPVSKNRQVLQTKDEGQVTYRLERVKCGKPVCKCSEGHLHGSYWYAYQRVNGKVKSSYIGKTMNEGGRS